MNADPNPPSSPEFPQLQPLSSTPVEPRGFYERLRVRFAEWAGRKGPATSEAAEALLILPDLLRLLSGLAVDPDVPPKQKAKVAIALFYIVSPLDFLPESVFGPLACLDDVIVAVTILNNLLNHVEPQVLQRHWLGDGDAIKTIQHVVAVTDELAGSGLLRRIRRFLED